MECNKCKIKKQIDELIDTHKDDLASTPLVRKMRIEHLVKRGKKKEKPSVGRIGHNHKKI